MSNLYYNKKGEHYEVINQIAPKVMEYYFFPDRIQAERYAKKTGGKLVIHKKKN